MRIWWGRRRHGERGATTVEYGLLVAGIVMGLLSLLGARELVSDVFAGECASISACGHCGKCD